MSTTTASLRALPRICSLSPLRPITQFRRHNTSAVDPSEISHFNALAADWWDPHGSSRLLHLMNPLRLQFLHRCLARSSSPPPKRYLDVGCGGGILAESLARLKGTEEVVAIDPTPGVLTIAREHMRQDPKLQGRLRYLGTTIDGLDEALAAEEGEKDGMFDVVTTMEVVEHVPNPTLFLEQCMAHVKPGGWIVGSTIARTWTSWFTTKLVAEDILNIVPRGTHDWDKYVNAHELEAFFRAQSGWGGRKGEGVVFMGCIYVPGLGWREVNGGEKVGNYFFAARRNLEE